ncbi:MAG: hypothetical protein J6Y37_07555 [Paludibacteraceae bacterium]|nr:hypothetical protein [Paludibacteraceae bacterium]
MEDVKVSLIESDFDKKSCDSLDLRMYVLCLKQLSPIDKGIQSCHAVVDYVRTYGLEHGIVNVWADIDKTLILLDGGTTSQMSDAMGLLERLNVDFAAFKEQDLGDLVTAIAFLVDERVYDIEKYPNFYGLFETDVVSRVEEYNKWLETIGGVTNLKMRELICSKRLAR